MTEKTYLNALISWQHQY